MEKVIYPKKPMAQPEKPILEKGVDRLDPRIGLWLTHDPAIYRDREKGCYYTYSTGAICQKSKDLVEWEMVGKVVDVPPVESSEWVGSTDIWAPDIVKVGDEYRLYCSNSTWGVRQSCIFLAVADNPEGPFEPRGVVLKTSDQLPVNAIDANVIEDIETGELYMVYGSFWGGCHVLLLDQETGLAAEKGIGTCVARRPGWMSTAIEGPYIIYNPDTGYYYLFVSYGSLKTDYNIRVGRSKSIKGPYVDFNGRNMTDMEDSDNDVGMLVMAGYRWVSGKPYMGPGHNSVLRDEDGSWYIVCHVREMNFKQAHEPSIQQIRKIFWTSDGWPVVSPQPYAGEVDQSIPEDILNGFYERINISPTLPQGIQHATPMKIGLEGYYENCSIQGRWTYDNGRLVITYGPHREEVFVTVVWDHELDRPTIGLCGMNENGVAFWAKRVEDLL